jgi:AraC-like DNA-binding protein
MPALQFSVPPLPHYLYSGEDTYNNDQKHPNRRNTRVFDLLIVTKGALFISEETEHWEVKAGQALILRPDCHHYSPEPCREKTHFYWVHFQTKGEWTEIPEMIRPVHHKQMTPFNQQELFPMILPKFCTLYHPLETYEKIRNLLILIKQPAAESRWEEQKIFQGILQELQKTQKPAANSATVRIAENAALYLQENHQKQVTYDLLGSEINFHPAYISRCMKKVFHCTPSEYLTHYRVEQSKVLLVNTDLPVSRISEQVGFSSTSYFTRTFFKLTDITPLKFRKSYR